MLRAKQLSNLSSNARSFFLSGSRCSTSDGSSCTCSEDESCLPRRQQTRNNAVLAQRGPALVPKASARVSQTSLLGDAGKLLVPHKVESVECPTLPQVVSAPISIRKSDCVSYASGIDAVENDIPYSSPPISDQFFKAGIAAVSFLSDLVNYKLPITDGSGINSPKNCMVDPTRPQSTVRSSNVKPIRRENCSKVYPKASPEAAVSSSTSNYDSTRDKSEKSSFIKGSKRVSNTPAGNSVKTCSIASDTCDRRIIPQKSKGQSNRSTANFNANVQTVQTSDTKYGEYVAEDYRKPPRETKMPVVRVPSTRRFASNGHIVENVAHILRQIRWGPAAEEALANLNYSMDPYQANQVLKQLQDHTVALNFFYWLKRQPGFNHDGHTYTTMVGILGRAKQFGAINKLLDQMVKDGCQPNVVTYNRLIHSYGRANYLNDAVDVFNEMQRVGCEPDRVTYCTLIDIHAKAGFLDFALEMYQRMQAAGLSPDTFTYSVIINCLGKAGHLAAAHKLFCEMVEQGCVPNLVTYNIMIALQAKARNYQSALKLYRDMQSAGFQPDKVTYSIVMEVLGHCGYLDEAEAVFSEMKRKNWVPDEPVYGLLVDLWGKAGNVEKAWQWYQTMLNTGLRPNVPTCNSLLSAFLRVHKLADAYNLLQSMLELGLNPSLQTYTLLLSCCTEARSPYDMGIYCELMAVTGHPAHMFLLSLPSAGPDGQNVRDHASKFLDLMHSEDRESKRGLVDAVVDFLHKSGLKEEAGSVWEVAAQRNVYPDAVKEKGSCYWLINLHVMSDGTAVTALSRTLAWFRQQMLVSGISPSRIDIVTGWGRRSRVTGSSMVRQAVQELLHIFSFPFFTENGNSGCFVGCGEPLNRWLLQPYVDRMHLL
ncbi:pentatricopeptide repeat-containing protein At1g18900 isoform X2 [Ricinus communis]|uniref:Pentatricopeptide repeat-containing protein, putative n=2 Tax=Ricinus communis TaxID=3988 RepID=B9R930_RICCO|nr:pentatricopeptide repeat-containing protein At1g18900 isoform X2 [Ricinus communis]EEF52107.1 pentatricopeptide repeat-containing protein, putative [Ricinus communis]|eukprot:XP_002511505.1 pentatricopeptide repeat-containing protein At1g18900 [Ricinus communis]